MINLKVKILDYDTGESQHLTLPCDLDKYLDKTHDIELVHWEGSTDLGNCGGVWGLNSFLKKINEENPDITLPVLDIIYEMSPVISMSDESFCKKICSNDFMLDEVDAFDYTYWSDDVYNIPLDEEYCAQYLAIELEIPFAKNITEYHLQQMQHTPEYIDWYSVWMHYAHMGFKCARDEEDTLYVFHWGND